MLTYESAWNDRVEIKVAELYPLLFAVMIHLAVVRDYITLNFHLHSRLKYEKLCDLSIKITVPKLIKT